MNRRSLLTGLGAITASGLMAGCGEAGPANRPETDGMSSPGTVESGQSDHDRLSSIASEWGFERIVDVETRGADISGRTPVDSVLANVFQDGTLVYLPPGRYRVEDAIVADGVDRLGIVGQDATIVPEDGFDGTIFGLGWPDRGQDLYVDGLEFDFTAENTGGRPILGIAKNRVVIRDVSVTGRADVDQDLVLIGVTNEDGTGLVERLSLPDGADPDSKVTGCEVGDENRGDLAFVDCHIAGFPDNGLYADPPRGSVEVHGGTYHNNGIAGVRINSPDPSVVRGVHVRCDTDIGGANMRGIRLRSGTDITVEDCRVELTEVTSSDGALTIANDVGKATVRNTRLHVDAEGINAIRIKSADSGTEGRAGPFLFDNVVVTGTASGREAVYAANRTGCLFRNVCVHQSGADRDGFVFTDVEGELVDCRISVTGEPIREDNSRVRRQNLVLDRAPGPSSDGPNHPCN